MGRRKKIKPVRILRGNRTRWDHSSRVIGKAVSWASHKQYRDLDPSIVTSRHKKTMTKMVRVMRSRCFRRNRKKPRTQASWRQLQIQAERMIKFTVQDLTTHRRLQGPGGWPGNLHRLCLL